MGAGWIFGDINRELRWGEIERAPPAIVPYFEPLYCEDILAFEALARRDASGGKESWRLEMVRAACERLQYNTDTKVTHGLGSYVRM